MTARTMGKDTLNVSDTVYKVNSMSNVQTSMLTHIVLVCSNMPVS